jgi:hypothetical protein
MTLKWSKNKGTGIYAAKMEEMEVREKHWWWRKIWKLNSPLKTRIFLWLALTKKILTWDDGQKRKLIGLEYVLSASPMRNQSTICLFIVLMQGRFDLK